MPASEDILLELTEPRVIVMRDRDRFFTLSCRRITREDWLCPTSPTSRWSASAKAMRKQTSTTTTPRCSSSRRACWSTRQGTKVAGDQKLTDLLNWPSRVPLAHRLQLGRVLQEVAPSHDQDPFLIHAEGEQVLIDAAWSAYTFTDEEYNERRAVRKFIGLKHVPEVAHGRAAQAV